MITKVLNIKRWSVNWLWRLVCNIQRVRMRWKHFDWKLRRN